MNHVPALALALALLVFGSESARADSPPAPAPEPQLVNCRVEVDGSDAEIKFHAEVLVGVGRNVVLTERNYGLTIDAFRVVNNRCHVRITYESGVEVKNGFPHHNVADALLLPGRRTTLLKGGDFSLAATATIE